MLRRHALALLPLALLAAGCDRHRASGPIEVAVIGRAVDAAPGRAAADRTAEVLATATAQGLVRFDAAGQIVPGLAARWIVSDDGRSLIFRLPDPVSGAARPAIGAETVARRLRAAIAPAGRNPLRPLLGAITDIDAVTPQVIDIELRAPRPNLLDLFAQPALAIDGPGGGGPFLIVAKTPGLLTLCEKTEAADDGDPAPAPAIIRLRGMSPGRAVARFVAGRAALVLGGTFADLPVPRAAGPARGRLRFDPVQGLFGLVFVASDVGLASQPAARGALAMVIDRERIAQLLAVPGWTPETGIVPLGTPELPDPVRPDWSALPLADRQAQARRVIAGLAMKDHPLMPLRVALPAGPGARLLFAALAADWRAIGVPAIAVDADAPADLRLIDTVAPADTAAFYLRRFACEQGVVCTAQADAALVAARAAPDLATRAVLLAQADALIAPTTPFIALGQPVRWSLVAPDLDLYRDSPRAIHPLIELRTPSKR